MFVIVCLICLSDNVVIFIEKNFHQTQSENLKKFKFLHSFVVKWLKCFTTNPINSGSKRLHYGIRILKNEDARPSKKKYSLRLSEYHLNYQHRGNVKQATCLKKE